jgi:hypothetical protein
MEHFISMYIDNELSLEEKILFVEQVYGNRSYKDDAVSLLKQEKLLRGILNHQAPETRSPIRARPRPFHSFGLAIAACLLLVFSFLAGTSLNLHDQSSQQNTSLLETGKVLHRFVIFQQDSKKVEITGSFTNWQKIPLEPAGQGGYWEITLEVPAGEQRYSFIVDGVHPQPDPTVAIREADDFGTMNSILNVES